MEQRLKTLIEVKDLEGIDTLLAANPSLANEGITVPFDSKCATKAHPLHRISDAVFTNNLSNEESIEIAKIFLEHGADINGDKQKGKDTPLLAAASLNAEPLGIFYIENGADIDYAGKNDGATALHWAAYCALDKLVEKLLATNAKIDQRDTRYDSTPLAWAIQPLLSGDKSNLPKRLNCIKILLNAGAVMKSLHPNPLRLLEQLVKDDWQLQ